MALHYSEELWTFTAICGTANPARLTNDARHPYLDCPNCSDIILARSRCMIYADERYAHPAA